MRSAHPDACDYGSAYADQARSSAAPMLGSCVGAIARSRLLAVLERSEDSRRFEGLIRSGCAGASGRCRLWEGVRRSSPFVGCADDSAADEPSLTASLMWGDWCRSDRQIAIVGVRDVVVGAIGRLANLLPLIVLLGIDSIREIGDTVRPSRSVSPHAHAIALCRDRVVVCGDRW